MKRKKSWEFEIDLNCEHFHRIVNAEEKQVAFLEKKKISRKKSWRSFTMRIKKSVDLGTKNCCKKMVQIISVKTFVPIVVKNGCSPGFQWPTG